jgi:uncharacterized protein YbjT (DUF2867 family)
MSKRTIFVTGASGNVGGATLDALDKSKNRIIAGIRESNKVECCKKKGVTETAVIEFGKKETLVNAFKGVDTLLLIPPGAESKFFDYFQTYFL